MKWKNRVLLLGLAAVIGCGDRGHEKPDAHHPETETPSQSEEAHAPGLLRIDAAMLRDLRITTTAAQTRSGGEAASVLGELGVDENAYAEIGSPIAARVTRILVAPGDRVRKHQAVVELQSVELGKAKADYFTAQARAKLTREILERKKQLAQEQIAPARELQEAQAEAAAAEANLRAARASLLALGVAEEDLDTDGNADAHFILRSPIAGMVLERAAMRGQMSDPARPLFRVADLARLWLVVHAFERDAIRMHAGDSARVEFAALPGRIFSGRVALIGRQVDVASRTIPVRIEIANGDGLLRPGMSATAWVPVGSAGQSIVAVPAASLQRMEEGWCVFIPRSEATFEMRTVGRGRDLGGEVEILSGLQSGEMIVVDGAFLLKAEADKSRGHGTEHEH